jgi:acyl-CoA reductase-like NAD-dependent aldehyde dehydrogenase
MELLEPAVKGVRVGDPGDKATEMGPLISAGQRETVASYVPDDAPVAFHGDCPGGPGYWYPPTGRRQWKSARRSGARRSSARWSWWCRSRTRPPRSGWPTTPVRYSTPFGGFKQSGLGRELGPDAVDAFTETKNLFIAADS